ncbi:PTS ascorbate transporter subunit IIC [Caldinitratiruptor microaerophilus]|uniref:Ascorbate-specific PTS system EIIC component n=1 Tax=Caldinitratiruptor microaerophilus TaxID=671077 RepID=A0AA35CLR5_9FIRM|nr:PTS ascorbate transporter subunit IIC [Caldinitratiruptor microaerophilus]BDG59605.1 PTS ascorbate transporter subunit IIC [Caldinitratiruptor microaerophilus]
MLAVAQWLANNLFGQPAFLIGLIVLVGLLVQKKTASQVISGTLKAVVGFLIIGTGAGAIVNSLLVFQPMWAEVFGLQQQALSNFMGFETFSQKYGGAVALVMTFGFLINVLLARFTRFKYIYLTGHMMFWTTAIWMGVVLDSLGSGTTVNTWGLIAFFSVFMGLYWTLQPALTQPFMRKVTGGDDIALGHTSASVAVLGALAGQMFGNKEQDAESLQLPKGLDFLKDSNVVIALLMGILYVIGAAIVGARSTPAALELVKKAGQNSFILYSLQEAFKFAGGIAVVLFGVRLLIGEIVPAFRGIATKIVPDARPALDCPVVYPYAPTASIVGFLGAFVASLVWLVVLGKTVGYVFVPTMIVLFFHAATAGVFGNATGGLRGAFLGGVITATVVAWGQWLMVTRLLPTTIPDTAMWAADSDMFLLGPLVKLLGGVLRFLFV